MAAALWLEEVLGVDERYVPLERGPFGRWSQPSRLATWAVARALSVHGGSESAALVRVRELIVDELLSPQPGAAPRLEAVAIQSLCAAPERARVLPVQRAVEIAAARLDTCSAEPEIVRAWVACEPVLGRLRVEAALARSLAELEREIEGAAPQPLASMENAADRLHAWHAAAGALGVDVRRHGIVYQSTLALVTRAEASGGEASAGMPAGSRRPGPRADTRTLARIAAALFAVEDPILGPRAAFAAELALDAACTRLRRGAARNSASWGSQVSTLATALVLEALCAAHDHASRPWSLSVAAPVIPLSPPDARSPRLA